MTISNQNSFVTHTGNSATTVWPFTFFIPTADDLVVTLWSEATSSVILAPGSYSVTGLGDPAGGAVTYPLVGSPISPSQTITVQRVVPLVQDTDFSNQTNFYPEVFEDALDYLMMAIQQLNFASSRAVLLPVGDPTSISNYLGEAQAAAAAAAVSAAEAEAAAAGLIDQWINAKQEGAVGDGVADDTTALQTAINLAITRSIPFYLPGGTYKITAPLTVTGPLTIIGAGRANSIISLASAILDGIQVSIAGGTAQFIFEKFQIKGQAGATAGDLIKLTSTAAGPTIEAHFRDLYFLNGFQGFHSVSFASWHVESCLFQSQTLNSAVIEDQLNLDGGDNFFTSNTMIGGGSGVAVKHVSAGGLRLAFNKITAYDYGYFVALAAGAATSQTFIVGNSIEGNTFAALRFIKDAGVGYGAVTISANQLHVDDSGICIDMSDASSAGWLSRVQIVGNIIELNANATGINLGSVSGFGVTSNYIAGGGGTTNGIVIGATCALGFVGGNTYGSISNHVVNSSTDVAILDPAGTVLLNLGQSVIGHNAQVTLTGTTIPAIQLHGNTPSTASQSISKWANDANAARLMFAKSRNATKGSHTVVQQDDVVGDITGWGSDGSVFRQLGIIRFEVDGVPGANDMPGRISMYTTPDGSGSPTTERWSVKQDGRILIASQPQFLPIVKNADETTASDTTLSDDAQLKFSVLASTKYRFRFVIFYDTPTAADLKFTIAGPAAPTLLQIQTKAIVPGATAYSAIAIQTAFAFGPTVLLESAGTNGFIEIEGILHNGANAGTVSFQWAQNTSNGSNTTVRAGSYVEYSAVS